METYSESTLQDLNTGIRVWMPLTGDRNEVKWLCPCWHLVFVCCTIVSRLLLGIFFFVRSVLNLEELQAFLKTEFPGLMAAACLDVGDESREIKTRPTLSFWIWDDICASDQNEQIEGQFEQEKIIKQPRLAGRATWQRSALENKEG